MQAIDQAGTFTLGGRTVKRLGYGAMQLAGPGVFGPPRDRDAALAVLREAVAAGVNHIDTSDFYGPHVTNQIIREALAPYPDDLTIVTKIGALRGDDASWNPAYGADQLERAVHDNLRNLGLEALDVVNLRIMFDVHGPAEGSIAKPLEVLAGLQRQGLVRHIGLSNVTATQVEGGPRHRRDRLRAEPVQPGPPRRRRADRRPGEGRDRLCAVLPAGRLQPAAVDRPVATSPRVSAPRRCRWPWPGCCGARPTSC
jgi:aryl-alcohol dehydrogenase-like predicted oxidoreductase